MTTTPHQKPIPLKQFCFEQAKLLNITPNAVWYRIRRNKHRLQATLQIINQRVVYVLP